MGCSHAVGCPLFPLLRASLQGWRDYYCDSGDQWLGCARYQLSLTGERVPISLLPNGAYARHLEHVATGTEQRQAAQPAPARPAQPSAFVPAASETAAHFGPASSTIPVSHHRPSPSPRFPQAADRPSRRAGQKPKAKRGWWSRFTEWMGGPA